MADQETPVTTTAQDHEAASPPEGVKGAVAAAISDPLLPTEEPEPTAIAEGQSPPEAVKPETAAEIHAATDAGSPPAAEATPTPEQARITELETALGTAQAELAAVRQAQTQAAQQLTEALGQAAARYRDLVARSNPEIPAELIAGATIDAVDQSIEAGKTVVAKVRAQLAAQATAVITPGVPVRTGTDVEALSGFEKIKYAVSHRDNRR